MKEVIMKMGDVEVPMLQYSDRLLVPRVLADSPNLQRFVEVASAILDALPAEVTSVPWLIGSTDRDIEGNPRESQSHREGVAFDLSPAFSGDSLTSPDRRLPGLAWNVASLTAIFPALAVATFAVEGDHLHVMLDREWKENWLPCVPTAASWYPNAESLEKVTDARLFNKLFKFRPIAYIPGNDGDRTKFLNTFKA